MGVHEEDFGRGRGYYLFMCIGFSRIFFLAYKISG